MRVLSVIGILFFMSLGFACSNPQEKQGVEAGETDAGEPVIEFSQLEHDFGKVKQGEKVGWYFKFRNTGNGSLIIKEANATCGCTVPDYSKKPVRPGEEGSLKVVYDSGGRSGFEVKTITVETNASNPVVQLKVKAEVVN